MLYNICRCLNSPGDVFTGWATFTLSYQRICWCQNSLGSWTQQVMVVFTSWKTFTSSDRDICWYMNSVGSGTHQVIFPHWKTFISSAHNICRYLNSQGSWTHQVMYSHVENNLHSSLIITSVGIWTHLFLNLAGYVFTGWRTVTSSDHNICWCLYSLRGMITGWKKTLHCITCAGTRALQTTPSQIEPPIWSSALDC